MLEQFKRYVTEQHLFSPEQQVLLAVSGGRDSVCMAHLMHAAGYRFSIAHCNFHLRPDDCDRDQQFVRQFADSFGVPFHTVDFDTRAYASSHGMGLEEAARRLRYDWFATLCAEQNYACLATAHHRDDSVETFFLNLMRGTGIAGLHGIRPLTWQGDMTVVRPMLCFLRADIDRYVEENGLEYVEDSTNSALDARRNRIRLQVMPLLRRLYPSVDATMQANIERLNDTERLYRAAVASLADRLVRPYCGPVPTANTVMVSIALDAIPEPRRTILYELLHPYGFNYSVTADILDGAQRTGSLFHSPTHDAVISRGNLIIGERHEPVTPVIAEDKDCFLKQKYSVIVDADTVRRPFTLRLWQTGDRFYPFGMTNSRKVSDYLKDRKLNRIEKRYVYVLVDADGRIVWIVGLCLDNRFRLTQSTSHTLRLSVKE